MPHPAPPSAGALRARYGRIESQLATLFEKTSDPLARMGSAASVLHHKMPHFFWTGFYRLVGEELVVGPYQGPLACMVLERDEGVCWAAVHRDETIVVPDVEAFPGHIACDARSKSEIALPVRDEEGRVRGVLDVDSERRGAFSDVDADGLEAIAALVYRG